MDHELQTSVIDHVFKRFNHGRLYKRWNVGTIKILSQSDYRERT